MAEAGTAKRSRRRGAELDSAVLEAVLAELDAHGYPGVTFEGVARRAHTSKPVLYRRWSSRAEMVIAALVYETRELPDIPDTGSLAGDTKAFLRSLIARFGERGQRVLLGVLSEVPPESATAAINRLRLHGTAIVSGVARELIARARARGEIGADPLPRSVLNLPLDLARYHYFLLGEFDEATVDDIVDTVFLPLVRAYQRPAP